MRAQLAGYKPRTQGAKEELAYEVACLEGSVRDRQGRTAARLDMYEMFWADLGKIDAGIFSVFSHLYQLLFHLPSLGRQAADYAALADAGGRRINPWLDFSRWRNGAVRIFTLAVPFLNLILVMASLLVLSGSPRLPASQPVAMTIWVLMSLALVLLWFYRRPPANAPSWFLGPIAAGAVLADAGAIAAFHAPQLALGVEAWLIGAAAIPLIARQYESVRPGARFTGSVVYLAALAAAAVCCAWAFLSPALRAATASDMIVLGLQIVGLGLVALKFTWMLAMAFFWVAFLASLWGFAITPEKDRRPRMHACWTAHATLGLSSALVLTLNLSVWSAIIRYVGQPLLAPAPQSGRPQMLHWAVDCVLDLIRDHVSWGFLLSSAAVALVLVVAFWGLAPSVIAEIHPPDRDDPKKSRRFGSWLSRGLGVIGWCVLSVGPALAVGVFMRHPAPFVFEVLGTAGLVVFALVGGKKWLGSIGVILGVMLEIDNYMREHPRESSPRARIAERFASLLRHIGQDQRHGARGYDAVIVVAHSQGAVISADLLRFLAIQRGLPGAPANPELEWLGEKPICLFTMGSPLRQLYGWCFPDLYRWAIPPAGWPGPEAAVGQQLGSTVRSLNVYRSGDYIGRCLWTDLTNPAVWTRHTSPAGGIQLVQDASGAHAEGCIGEGAHTHYWDATARDVATLLHHLIVSNLHQPFTPFPP